MNRMLIFLHKCVDNAKCIRNHHKFVCARFTAACTAMTSLNAEERQKACGLLQADEEPQQVANACNVHMLTVNMLSYQFRHMCCVSNSSRPG